MSSIVVATLTLAGAALILLASIGLLRMPDVFLRMQATTKAASLGVCLVLLATAFHFERTGVTTRAVATIAFIFLTAPISAHLLSRAAYFLGVPLWHGSVRDDLRPQFEAARHFLHSGEAPPPPAPGQPSDLAADER